MYCKIVLAGNLGKAPEEIQTATGTKMATMSIAVNRWTSDRDKSDVSWFSVKAWGGTADYCLRYLEKGSLILVEGEMVAEKYVNKEGVNQVWWTVYAKVIKNLGRSSDKESHPSKDSEASAIEADRAVYTENIETDIPF